jgi:hypothetical protein
MERMYAYIASAGNYGFQFGQAGVSGYITVTTVLIPESRLDVLKDHVNEIIRANFQGEEKLAAPDSLSQGLRCKILEELLGDEFNLFSVVADKKKIYDNIGPMQKEVFYKFIHNLVYKELRYGFRKLAVCGNEGGAGNGAGNEYLESFLQYVRANEDVPDLFGEREFYLEENNHGALIWLAEFINNTLSSFYEAEKRNDIPNYLRILDKKIIRIEHYPKDLTDTVTEKGGNGTYNNRIIKICQELMQHFLDKYKNTEEEDRLNQIIVLKYLSFRFLNNNTGSYISTRELIGNLRYRTGKSVSMQYFRTRIIAKLRDEGVIIASSPKGYKIPSREEELYDFINHGTSIIMPMLARLKKCRDNISQGTDGELDLFASTEYSSLKEFFDL